MYLHLLNIFSHIPIVFKQLQSHPVSYLSIQYQFVYEYTYCLNLLRLQQYSAVFSSKVPSMEELTIISIQLINRQNNNTLHSFIHCFIDK